jgi:hypothetical protein
MGAGHDAAHPVMPESGVLPRTDLRPRLQHSSRFLPSSSGVTEKKRAKALNGLLLTGPQKGNVELTDA